MKKNKIPAKTWSKLAKIAWTVRENARILEDTRVGCALLTNDGKIFSGCNVEHSMRSHDVHAETNAIGSMVAGGGKNIAAIVVVAECSRLTPCGSCLDWINEFGGPDCLVGVQSKQNGELIVFRTDVLFPYPPKK
ncbi:MAG: cytidine deaminase family protein [Bacteroidota bacterium]